MYALSLHLLYNTQTNSYSLGMTYSRNPYTFFFPPFYRRSFESVTPSRKQWDGVDPRHLDPLTIDTEAQDFP